MSGASRPSDAIRRNLEAVALLRQRAERQGEAEALRAVKRLQADRFRFTYADFGARPRSRAAVRFFLEELYGAHDFSSRDEQFGRIAGALERMFPAQVNRLAVDLTELHALTEQLDHGLARCWLSNGGRAASERYVVAWREAGGREARARQLAVVLDMGRELQRLTRMRSLRLALRMMRQPARAAGLEALQHFLESGFDAFAELAGDTEAFLEAIAAREADWIEGLFTAEISAVVGRLDDCGVR